MPPSRIGLVVGKDFRPLPGETSGEWCYITVDLSEEERISVRISPSHAKKIGVGDVVEFRKPRGENRPVRRLKRLATDPRLLP